MIKSDTVDLFLLINIKDNDIYWFIWGLAYSFVVDTIETYVLTLLSYFIQIFEYDKL